MANFEHFDDLLGGGDNTDVLSGFDFDAFLNDNPSGAFDFDNQFNLGGDQPLETMGE